MAVDGERLSPATLLDRLNRIAGANGVGRIDLVENRFVGMKSRGVYETPGGTVLLAAHRAIESLTLDRGAAHLKDELMPRYAELIYNGFWFSPERQALQALIDETQKTVTGTVRLKLYKGNVIVTGRKLADEPLRPGHRDLRGRPGLRPARRRGLHQAERAPPAAGGAAARAGLNRSARPQSPAVVGSIIRHQIDVTYSYCNIIYVVIAMCPTSHPTYFRTKDPAFSAMVRSVPMLDVDPTPAGGRGTRRVALGRHCCRRPGHAQNQPAHPVHPATELI